MNWQDSNQRHKRKVRKYSLTKVQTYKRLEGDIEGQVYGYQTDITTWLHAMYSLVCAFSERKQNEYHAALLHKYVEIPYQKFHKDPEYLFWMGLLSEKFGEAFLGKDPATLYSEALQRTPQNLVCLSFYYFNLDASWSEYRKQIKAYMMILTHPEPRFRQYIRSKGVVGEYFLSRITQRYESCTQNIKAKTKSGDHDVSSWSPLMHSCYKAL